MLKKWFEENEDVLLPLAYLVLYLAFFVNNIVFWTSLKEFFDMVLK